MKCPCCGEDKNVVWGYPATCLDCYNEMNKESSPIDMEHVNCYVCGKEIKPDWVRVIDRHRGQRHFHCEIKEK